MAVVENPLLFLFRYTPFDDLICTVFEQKCFLPIIGMNFGEELFLVLCFPINWDFPCFQIISNMSIARAIPCKKRLLKEFIINGGTVGVMSYGQSGEVICHYIFHPLLVFNLEIEFLE